MPTAERVAGGRPEDERVQRYMWAGVVQTAKFPQAWWDSVRNRTRCRIHPGKGGANAKSLKNAGGSGYLEGEVKVGRKVRAVANFAEDRVTRAAKSGSSMGLENAGRDDDATWWTDKDGPATLRPLCFLDLRE